MLASEKGPFVSPQTIKTPTLALISKREAENRRKISLIFLFNYKMKLINLDSDSN